MITDQRSSKPSKYEFTVKRITLLQTLLGRADKKTVNKFIDEVRRTVYFYHEHERECLSDETTKSHDEFFTKLNNKAHQLARFTTELSILVSEAPPELFNEAKKADRAIDAIHGNLVNVCLTIDELFKQKNKYIIDISIAVQTIFDAYCKVFEVKPNGRLYVDEMDIPYNAPLEDLLVPVVRILTNKSLDRSYKLVKLLIK